MPTPAKARSVRMLAILGAFVVLIVVAGMLLESQDRTEPLPSDIQNHTQRDPAVAAGEQGTCGGQPLRATRELRAMWLTTVVNIDWPSRPGLDTETVKAEYRGWLDLAQRQHHNAIYVHVRPSGDALWPSQYAPWSEWLTGKRDGVSPGWDPMEWMIAETHARNIEFHAWMNPYRGGQPGPKGPGGDLNNLAPNHPLRAHPEWAIVYPTNTPGANTTGTRLYFDPGIPDARRFVEDSMLEAVQRYDVDGVHFDDFFYPYKEQGQEFPDDASFATYGKNFANKGDWRRDNVNTMVREMQERIKAIKPWVKFSISPFGIWRNNTTDPTGSATSGLQAYDEIYADTVKWVKQRWIDAIVPQLYWNVGFDRADYAKLLPWWSTVVEGTGVQLYIGMADYRIGEAGPWSDAAEIDRQLTLNQQYKVQGAVHFSAKSVRDDALGAVTAYSRDHYAQPALMPVMAQLPAEPPAAPIAVGARTEGDGVTVTWKPGDGKASTSYAIYRLAPNAGAAELVGTVRSSGAEQSFVDRGSPAGSRYCVTGLDRSANEGRVSPPMSVA